MRVFCFSIGIVVLFLSGQAIAQEDPFKWPDGAKAAICLTYDDAIDSHLDVAIPDLNKYGFRGTFYMEGDNIRIERLEEWTP